MDSLAAAMAAIEAAAPSRTRPVEWTPDADAVIRAGYAKQLARRDLARIVSQLLGRTVSHEPIQRRAVALGIA